MNSTLSRFHLPAIHATRQLNNTLNEIAHGVRELRDSAPADAPPENQSAKVESTDEPARHDSEANTPAEPQKAGDTAHLPARAAEHVPVERKPEARVESPSPQEAIKLTSVPDLRPQLAAFVAAMNQQHEATVRTLWHVTDLCARQQRELQRLGDVIGQLSSRLDYHIQRP